MADPAEARATGWHVSRRQAWTLLSILPLWVAAFVFLTLIAGAEGPPPAPKTLAEAVDQYADVSTVGWIAWSVFAGGILVLTAFAAMLLGRAARNLHRGAIAAWLGAAAFVAGAVDAVVTIYMTIGLKLADPPSYLPLIERFALDIENAKVWVAPLTVSLVTATAGVVAAILWREKLLGRAAPVLAVAAGVLLLIGLVVPVPVLPAILLAIFGIVLLRARNMPYSLEAFNA
jgi:hypothetical protein